MARLTPDVPKPSIPKPAVPKPDVPKPDVPKPDLSAADRPKPDVPRPEGIEPPADAAAALDRLVAGARHVVAGAVVEAGRAEALALAVIDTAAHLRRMSTVSLAAIAAGLDKILTGEAELGEAAIGAAEKSLDLAVARLRQIVELAGVVTGDDRTG